MALQEEDDSQEQAKVLVVEDTVVNQKVAPNDVGEIRCNRGDC